MWLTSDNFYVSQNHCDPLFCNNHLRARILSCTYTYTCSVVDTEVMGWALETILTKFAVGTSPLVRQASCVWLLTALKLAGKHPDIQVMLYNYLAYLILN